MASWGFWREILELARFSHCFSSLLKYSSLRLEKHQKDMKFVLDVFDLFQEFNLLINAV